jgi:ADP-ribosylglycohydrolase
VPARWANPPLAVSYEDAIKNAISLGGDADTMACIAGGIAQAYYKAIPEDIVKQVRATIAGGSIGHRGSVQRGFSMCVLNDLQSK